MIERLAGRLNELSDTELFQTSWYLKDLATGADAHRLGDVVVAAASTRKIAILAAALRLVHQGTLALDQPVDIHGKHQDNHSGVFQHLRPGFTITLQDALVMLTIVADNTCSGAVTDLVGMDAINALCESVGMTGTIHRRRTGPLSDEIVVNATTANDMGLLLDCLLQGTSDPDIAARLGSTPELCRLALQMLTWQKLNQRMPAMLPAGTKVAHQNGTRNRNINDAGIVYVGAQPRFILTVYTDKVPVEMSNGLPGHYAAEQLIAQLTRACWDNFAS